MSQYGAFYLQWAPITEETADALPEYGDPVNLGALTKVTDAPTYSSVTANGDNRVRDSVDEFTGGTVDVNVTELENPVAAKIYGVAHTDEEGDLVLSTEDAPPYGGMAFCLNKVKGTVKFFQGVFYPKLKAVPQGNEFNTKAKSGAVLTGGKIHFNWEAPEYGKYFYMSPELQTEAEAKAWVDSKIKKAAAAG